MKTYEQAIYEQYLDDARCIKASGATCTYTDITNDYIKKYEWLKELRKASPAFICGIKKYIH